MAHRDACVVWKAHYGTTAGLVRCTSATHRVDKTNECRQKQRLRQMDHTSHVISTCQHQAGDAYFFANKTTTYSTECTPPPAESLPKRGTLVFLREQGNKKQPTVFLREQSSKKRHAMSTASKPRAKTKLLFPQRQKTVGGNFTATQAI